MLKQMNQQELLNALKAHFSFSEFRGAQQEILIQLYQNKNILALMPTGLGKSLCYQLPAKLSENLVLVISPLIALMQDQVSKAREFGIRATFINSSISREEKTRRLQQVAENKIQLLFVTPERFRNLEFRETIKKIKVELLAIDEAHCASLWGHDFRPDYAKINEFRQFLGSPQTIALTATATPEVQKDILKIIGIEDAQLIQSGMKRENLQIRIHDVYGLDEKIRGLFALRHQVQGAAIYYFSLIDTLRKVSAGLRQLNIPHLVYHGDLSPQERKKNLNQFMNEESPLMLATPAFGLGIDKKNVHLLAHAEIPGSIESYFQEIGRAGRDGVLSECHLFYDQEDVSIQMEFLKWAYPEKQFIQKVYQLIEKNRLKVDQFGFDFLREQMVFKSRRDFRVESAVNILERWGCLEKNENSAFPFVCVREPTDEEFNLENNELLLKQQNTKLLEILRLVTQTTDCRMLKIYQYFGLDSETECGICDVCQGKQG